MTSSIVTSSIQERLEAFVAGEVPPEAFLSELSAICHESPDSTWEILALLDQYHRRRRLSGDLHRSFRRQIEFNALGITNPDTVRSVRESHDAPAPEPALEPAPAPATSTVAEEVDKLRAELASERKKSQRYRHRIGTLAQYGHRQRTSLSQAADEAPATDQVETAMETEPPVPAIPAVAGELEGLRAELANEREKSQRYRHRIAMLAQYGHRQRTSSLSYAVAVVPQTMHTARKARVAHAALVSRVAPVWLSGRELVAEWFPRGRRFQRPHVGSSAAVLLAAATAIIAGSSANVGFAPNLIEATSALIATGPVPELQVSPIPEPPTISLADERFLVLPGYTLATIQVQRTGGGNGPVKFTWWTQSAGAKAGKDFASGKRRVAQIEAGESSVELNVRILSNPQRKHTELFYVEIGDPGSDASIGAIRRAPVFIMRSGLGS